ATCGSKSHLETADSLRAASGNRQRLFPIWRRQVICLLNIQLPGIRGQAFVFETVYRGHHVTIVAVLPRQVIGVLRLSMIVGDMENMLWVFHIQRLALVEAIDDISVGCF